MPPALPAPAGAPGPRLAHSALIALLAAAAGGLWGAEQLEFGGPAFEPGPAPPPPGPICQAPLVWGCPDCPEVPACPACPACPEPPAAGPALLEQLATHLLAGGLWRAAAWARERAFRPAPRRGPPNGQPRDVAADVRGRRGVVE